MPLKAERMFFTNIKNEILTLNKECPVFIYIGIGTAAGLINSDSVLEMQNYHQFPPFLQSLHQQVPEMHLFLGLIDPHQEDPPYLLQDIKLASNNLHIHIHVWRQDVHTEPDEFFPVASINISENLRDLNQFSMENNVSLLYHDFTGRRTALVAEYFDHEINGRLDQIVYGMSARENHGCYFDLAKPTSYFPFRIEKTEDLSNRRPIIKLFNYFKFIVNDSFHLLRREISLFPEHMQPLIEEQKKQIISSYFDRFKYCEMSLLRQAHMAHNVREPIKENDTLTIHFDINRIQRHLFNELYKEKNYKLLYELVFNFCANQLNVISNVKQLDINGEEMLLIIIDDKNPYQWLKNIEMFNV